MAKKAAKKSSGTELVIIPPIKRNQVVAPIRGLESLIVHRFGKKVQQQMLDKQMGKAKGPKAPRDPEADYQESMHRFADGRYGFPASGLKKAMVRAGKMLGINMTDLRQMFFVVGEPGRDGIPLIEIFGVPNMRQDYVRIPGTSDVRFRAEFKKWSAEPLIEYDPGMITPEQVFNLVNRAGFSVGLGEWRPEKDGEFGRFEVVVGGKVRKATKKKVAKKKAAKKKAAKKRTKKAS